MNRASFFQNRVEGLSELVRESIKKTKKIDRHTFTSDAIFETENSFYEPGSIKNEPKNERDG
jgi:hypothetical protein